MSQERPKEPSRKPTLPVGTPVAIGSEATGVVTGVRRRKRFARRYFVDSPTYGPGWFRRDELSVSS